MEDILKVSKDVFDPLKPNDTFDPIAEELMKNYCVKCGEKIFFLAEIEFYYYRASDKEVLEKLGINWEGVTYSRETNAGDFLYHLSGCDICFPSDKNECGGILIRSLVDDAGNLVVGPLNCVNAMLNACGKNKNVPYLLKTKNKRDVIIHSTYRFLGDDDFKKINNGNKDGELKLAFFDSNIKQADWNKARPSYYSTRFKYANQK